MYISDIKKTLLVLMGWMIFCNNAKGQAMPPALETSPGSKTLLWEVSGNGLPAPSYFLGTMHILCPEDAFLSAATHKILDTVNALYLEIDMDNMFQMLGAMKAMTMRNDTTLEDLLNPQELERLKTAMAEKMTLPLPFSVLQRYKPMLLAGMFSEQMLPCKAGAGTEMLLMAEARKRKLSIEGLETPAYQAGIFDSIPYALQAKELLKAIDGQDGQTDMVDKMVKAFKEQDIETLGALTVGEEGGLSGFLDVLIFQRNRNWVEAFSGIAKKGAHLFAVGAGHLPGETGVLSLLEKKGYTLRPLLNVVGQ
jgi:uncharacterized protein YbaP (TraB family)